MNINDAIATVPAVTGHTFQVVHVEDGEWTVKGGMDEVWACRDAIEAAGFELIGSHYRFPSANVAGYRVDIWRAGR